jgi:hypothetical protein
MPIRNLLKYYETQELLNLFYWQSFSEESFSGESVLIQGVECGLVKVPLHHVNLTSDLVSGPVTVGVRSVLPVDGVHLLLGNDLAGDKVVVNPIVTDKPVLEEVYDPIIEDVLHLYPACAVTRAMAQIAILYQPTLSLDPDLSYDLSDAFLGQSDDQICNSLPKTSCEVDAKFNESHDSQVPAKGLSDSSFLYVPNENMSGQKVSSVKIPTEGFPVLSTE